MLISISAMQGECTYNLQQNLKILYTLDHTILFKTHQHVVQILIK